MIKQDFARFERASLCTKWGIAERRGNIVKIKNLCPRRRLAEEQASLFPFLARRSRIIGMDVLAKLFGSSSRVKLMRLFLMNIDDVFDLKEVEKRSKVSGTTLRKEVKLFQDVGLIKTRTMLKMQQKPSGKVGEMKKRKVNGYSLDSRFPYLTALRALVTEIALGKEDVAARFRNCGQLKLIIVAGIFLDDADSRVDILLVGDKVKKPLIEGALRRLEAELGKELTYSVMETPDFEYRFGIYDKFIRDILDYPHLMVLNKLSLF